MKIDESLFLPPAMVAELIAEAAGRKSPFSMIRIGDGEALTMAQDTVRSAAYVREHGFLRDAGVILPDKAARLMVVEAVRRADLVGVAARRDLPDFAPLTEEVLAYHGLRPAKLCDCCINYALQGQGLLIPLLQGRKLFLVNRRWPVWARALERLYGLRVAGGAIVDHFGMVGAALTAAKCFRFEISLLAAGVPATWLAVRLAAQNSCVALDLGRLADLMIDLA